MSEIAIRLREERDRLGLNQTDFGAIAGVKRNAQMNYENGTRKPDADYLAAIASHGVDVGYLITGLPTITSAALQEELAALSSAWEAIVEALQEAQKTLPADKMRLAAEALYRAVKEGEGQPKPLARLLTEAA